jgi:hypothetical protein
VTSANTKAAVCYTTDNTHSLRPRARLSLCDIHSLVKVAHRRDCSTPPLLLHAHPANSTPNMSGSKPYHVDKDKSRAGDDGIIVPIEGSLRIHPTAEEEQAVSNSKTISHLDAATNISSRPWTTWLEACLLATSTRNLPPGAHTTLKVAWLATFTASSRETARKLCRRRRHQGVIKMRSACTVRSLCHTSS